MKKVPKPKPAFNDGQKLDNSRDWERVKIAQPPIEDLTVQGITTLDPIAEHKETLHDITELLSDDIDEDDDNLRKEAPFTISSAPTSAEAKENTTDRTQLIRQELQQVQQDMAQNVKLLNWLNAKSNQAAASENSSPAESNS